MKKTILLLCIGFLNLMNAQEKKEYFVVKAGTNTGFYSGKIANWEGKISYQVGLALDIPISSKISFIPELNFTRLNSESNRNEFWGGQTVNVEQILRMSIISSPLVFKYDLSTKFNIQLGPQINYITFVERERPGIMKTDKPKAYTKNFDLGPSIGIGYNISYKFLVEARYFVGLMELDKNPGSYNTYTNSDLGKINIATISFGYRL